jgi:16S rRNA processing protein RimM
VKTIGRISRIYGFEGAVMVRTESGNLKEPIQGEPVFVVIDGLPVPFFTREAVAIAPDTLIISFDDYLTAESVAPFKGCELRISDTDNEAEDIADLKGYTLIDREKHFTGVITGVNQSPGQLLATVRTEGREILVPLHPDLIIALDEGNMIIEMSLPEGLTGLND